MHVCVCVCVCVCGVCVCACRFMCVCVWLSGEVCFLPTGQKQSHARVKKAVPFSFPSTGLVSSISESMCAWIHTAKPISLAVAVPKTTDRHPEKIQSITMQGSRHISLPDALKNLN